MRQQPSLSRPTYSEYNSQHLKDHFFSEQRRISDVTYGIDSLYLSLSHLHSPCVVVVVGYVKDKHMAKPRNRHDTMSNLRCLGPSLSLPASFFSLNTPSPSHRTRAIIVCRPHWRFFFYLEFARLMESDDSLECLSLFAKRSIPPPPCFELAPKLILQATLPPTLPKK